METPFAPAVTSAAGRLAAPLLRHWSRRVFRRGWWADRQFHAVLLVWFLCWAAYGLFLFRFCLPLPWADEWELTAVATGNAPLTQEWIWRPINEHRAPLTRLEVLLLGRLTSWDLRLIHHLNLDLLALGSLLLVAAIRKVRGHAVLTDAFLPLLILTPWQYESILVYAYAYAMALAFLCMALSALVTGWPLRSTIHLVLYLVLLLAITLSGGPAGNLWALGLCGVVARGCLVRRPLPWRLTALVGGSFVGAVSIAMLLLTPQAGHHEHLLSDSLATTLNATARLLVVWMGTPLPLWWPWAILAVLIPGLYVVGRMVGELIRLGRGARSARRGLGGWLDLMFILAAVVAVAVLIGHGRGLSPHLWQPRYSTLLLPVPLVLFLLMARWRAPVILPGTLTLLMAVCVGWNWPSVLGHSRYWHDTGMQVVRALRSSSVPLSAVAQKYATAVGYDCDPDKLLRHLLQLREAHLSLFQEKTAREPVPGMGPSRLWEAESGQFSDGLRLVEDRRATGGLALEAAADSPPGTVSYAIDVPVAGCYELFCRLLVPQADAFLTVRVDDGPALNRLLPLSEDYYVYGLQPIVIDLNVGRHLLTVALGMTGTKLDLLELIPRGRDFQDVVALAETK
jgi:hypothetical protein